MAMVMKGLEDMAEHFLPRHRHWTIYGRMWIIIRRGQEGSSHIDYILGTDRHLFQNIAAWDPRHNLDHYFILG